MTGFVERGRWLIGVPRRIAAGGKRVVEGVAFWIGVTLPFVYIPLAILGRGVQLVTFVGLVAVNYVALAVGAGHDRTGAD